MSIGTYAIRCSWFADASQQALDGVGIVKGMYCKGYHIFEKLKCEAHLWLPTMKFWDTQLSDSYQASMFETCLKFYNFEETCKHRRVCCHCDMSLQWLLLGAGVNFLWTGITVVTATIFTAGAYYFLKKIYLWTWSAQLVGCLSSGSYNLLHIERLIGHCKGTSSGRLCIRLRCSSYLKEKYEGIISYLPASRILSYGLNGWKFVYNWKLQAGKWEWNVIFEIVRCPIPSPNMWCMKNHILIQLYFCRSLFWNQTLYFREFYVPT